MTETRNVFSVKFHPEFKSAARFWKMLILCTNLKGKEDTFLIKNKFNETDLLYLNGYCIFRWKVQMQKIIIKYGLEKTKGDIIV